MDAYPGFNYFEKFREGIQWFMMESKDFISNFILGLENDNGKSVSFNSQNITLRLTIQKT